jgi:hypothetical protein
MSVLALQRKQYDYEYDYDYDYDYESNALPLSKYECWLFDIGMLFKKQHTLSHNIIMVYLQEAII